MPTDTPAPPKRSRKSKGQPKPKLKATREFSNITTAQYNALFKAYLEKPTIAYAAEQAGVNVMTAKRYIDGPGNLSAGMEPIAQRVARVNAAANEAQDLTLIQFRKDRMKVVLEGLKTSDLNMAVHRKHAVDRAQALQRGEDVAATEPFSREVVNQDMLVRLGERCLGGADATIAHRGFDPLDDLDDDEAMAYATTGILPERVRMLAAAYDAAKANAKGGKRPPEKKPG